MWIARNKDKSLRLFHNKPYKSSNEWKSKYEGESEFYLTEEDFPEVTWEGKPIEVDIFSKEPAHCAKDTALHFYLTKELYNNENYLKVIRNRAMYENIIIIFEYELDEKTNIGTAYVNSLATLENVFRELERYFYKEEKIDEVDYYIGYLESLNDDFAMNLESDALRFINKKMKNGEWKTFGDRNLDEIKKYLLEGIYSDFQMMKEYFPKNCKKISDLKYLDQWFDFKKYKLDGADTIE